MEITSPARWIRLCGGWSRSSEQQEIRNRFQRALVQWNALQVEETSQRQRKPKVVGLARTVRNHFGSR
jgi:hypothetical protein